MTHTLQSVRTQTVAGNHQLVVIDDDDTEHIFTASLSGIALIEALNTASVGIELGDAENAQIASDVFDRILTSIAPWSVLDPERAYTDRPAAAQPAGAVVDHDDIHAIQISVTDYDNGYFPSGRLDYFRKDGSVLVIEDSEATDYGIVAVVDDGDLSTELKELGGDYRHDADWTLTITRDGQYSDSNDLESLLSITPES